VQCVVHGLGRVLTEGEAEHTNKLLEMQVDMMMMTMLIVMSL